jgi:hypothetical protein
MNQRTIDAAAIEAEVDQIRSLGVDALRARWSMLFGAAPPDTTYSSLSIIAQAITGTKWNGPRFFGLRVPSRPKNADAATDSRSQKQKAAKQNRSSVRASDHRCGNG